MKGPHQRIHNLGKYAVPPKSNVNYAGPKPDQVAKGTPAMIGKKVPPATVSKTRMKKS